jgi:hypothetical protein
MEEGHSPVTAFFLAASSAKKPDFASRALEIACLSVQGSCGRPRLLSAAMRRMGQSR